MHCICRYMYGLSYNKNTHVLQSVLIQLETALSKQVKLAQHAQSSITWRVKAV